MCENDIRVATKNYFHNRLICQLFCPLIKFVYSMNLVCITVFQRKSKILKMLITFFLAKLAKQLIDYQNNWQFIVVLALSDMQKKVLLA